VTPAGIVHIVEASHCDAIDDAVIVLVLEEMVTSDGLTTGGESLHVGSKVGGTFDSLSSTAAYDALLIVPNRAKYLRVR